MASAAKRTKRIGSKVAGKYELTEVLGDGGMATVYAGHHAWTGREVAVKILHRRLLDDDEIVQRFLQEARTSARIEHMHVVDVLDMGKDDEETVYLVLERLRGVPLSHRLKEGGPLDPKEAVELLAPIMDALQVAHDAHIVHRDLKPDNIFLHEDPQFGVVSKLLDFGIAKVLDDTIGAKTQTGVLVGTPYYMAPEQILTPKKVGPPADVWAIATLFYESVTGERPFPATSPQAAFALIVAEEPKSLRDVAPEVPAKIAHWIDMAITKYVEGRPTMSELARGLRSAVGLSTDTVSGVVKVPSRRSGQVQLPGGKVREPSIDEVPTQLGLSQEEALPAGSLDETSPLGERTGSSVPVAIPNPAPGSPAAQALAGAGVTSGEGEAFEEEPSSRFPLFIGAGAVLIAILIGLALGLSGGDEEHEAPFPPPSASQGTSQGTSSEGASAGSEGQGAASQGEGGSASGSESAQQGSEGGEEDAVGNGEGETESGEQSAAGSSAGSEGSTRRGGRSSAGSEEGDEASSGPRRRRRRRGGGDPFTIQ